MRLLLLILAISGMFHTSFAQQVNAYNRYVNADQSEDFVSLSNGDMIFWGKDTLDMFLMRTDKNGAEKWSKKIAASLGIPMVRWMAKNDEETFFMLGTIIIAGQQKMLLSKADTSGNIIWSKALYRNTTATALSVIKTSDNNLLVLGHDSLRVLLVKLDADGNEIWSKQYYNNNLIGNTLYATFGVGSMLEMPDNSIVMLMPFVDIVPGYPDPVAAATLIKVDEDGDLLWAKMLSRYLDAFPPITQASVGHDVMLASDGNFIVAMGGQLKYNVIKVDPTGEVIGGNCLKSETQFYSLISEYPAGTLNVKGTLMGTVTLLRPDLNFSTATGTELTPIQDLGNLIGGQNFFTIHNVRQLDDKRIVWTGRCSNRMSILITDSLGVLDCASAPFTEPTAFDTTIHSFPTTVLTATGIQSVPVTLTAGSAHYPHCNCDSFASASFTYSVSGLTVTFTNAPQNAATYTWDFGDGNTGSGANPVHTYTGSLPTDPVILVVSNACNKVSDTVTIVPVSVNNVKQNEVNIYPNPFNDLLEIDGAANAEIIIRSVTGSEVAHTNARNGKCAIRTERWPSGIYFVTIKSNSPEAIAHIKVLKY